MEALFIAYHTLLRRKGMYWLLTANQNVDVRHMLSVVKPKTFQTHLESDLAFAHYEPRKNFKNFIKQDFKVSHAFQLLDKGLKSIEKRTESRTGSYESNRHGTSLTNPHRSV